ncbi:MAG TPA: adenylyltransferase/cytidyltransferase family protein [Burkholderiaceae bacterium]|nr:adenylyltransferase/cytidyltransferase family protein [Burkholderiaceae bacterium]
MMSPSAPSTEHADPSLVQTTCQPHALSTGAQGPNLIGGTIGAFDLFHVGHLRFLTAARQLCSHLKVGVGSDRLLPISKGRAPLRNEAERMEILRGLRCVDEVCVFDVGLDQTDAAAQWIANWPVNIVFVSSEWIDTPRWQRLAPALAAHHISCHALPYTEGVSTTALRRKMALGALEAASRQRS